MLPLHSQLSRLGLQEYYEVLAGHGFESWHDLMDITEEDLIVFNFKLGHRRKLQRAIASFRGKPYCQPLACSDVDLQSGETPTSNPTKRRYQRRRPKDIHAPHRPQTGYVLFANFLRQNHFVSDLPFVDIAKLVGQQWHCLSTEERAPWMSLAAEQKDRYKVEFLDHRRTVDYQRHQALLRTYKESKREANGRLCRSERSASRRSSTDSNVTTATTQNTGHSVPCGEESLSSTGTSSTVQESDEAETQYQYSNSNMIRPSTHDPIQSVLQQAISDNDRTRISLKHQPVICPDLTDYDKELLELRSTTPCTREFRDHFIQGHNPFHELSTAAIWPLMEGFLQCVNTSYHSVEAEDLIRQFLLAVDINNNLPSHVIYTLCFCISVGCRVNFLGTDEMAMVWYENGRRYLDDDGWGKSECCAGFGVNQHVSHE